MKRFLSVALLVTAVVLLAGVAFAQMAGGMDQGMMGSGMMGGAPGQGGCPGMTATGTTQTQITEEKARDLAQQYADKYLKGFTVDKVLPFAGMHMAMYQVELKGPEGETRILHVNPWGNVMPFGGPWRRG